MNVESIIKENAMKLKSNVSNVYISPDIPVKKLNNAIAAYGEGVQPGYVLALVDTTIFGSAKEGILLLGDRFYNSRNKRAINYLDIKNVEILPNYKNMSDGTQKEIEPSILIEIEGAPKQSYDEILYGINKPELFMTSRSCP